MIETQSYHAIYEGMECIYNEPIRFNVHNENKKTDLYTMRMSEASGGRFYIIAMHANSRKSGATVELWRATDDIYSKFELESTKKLGTKMVGSFSVSCPRSFSVQDDVIDCFFGGDSNSRKPYYFTVNMK